MCDITNKVLVVHNIRSSHATSVRCEVLKPLRDIFSTKKVADYQIKPTSFEDNVKQIAKLLKAGDIVIAAGGDGTATIAANAVLESRLETVKIGFLGYGNFNDMAGTFSRNVKNAKDLVEQADKTVKVRPLDIAVNGRHFRHGILYATVGLLARATAEFEDKNKRRNLRGGRANVFYSWWVLSRFYFKQRIGFHLPGFWFGGRLNSQMTDFLAINGPQAAKTLRTSGELYLSGGFNSILADLSKLPSLIILILRGFFKKLPAKNTKRAELNFAKPSIVDFQSEGEHRQLTDVSALTITKSSKYLLVIKP